MQVYCFQGIFVTGEKSIFFSDLSNIYADVLMGLKNKILSGDGIIYNWNMGGGINFLPLIFGNLSSVLNICVFILPDNLFQETVLLLQLVRIGLAGISIYLYLSYHYEKDNVMMVGIAAAYSLSAYMVCFIQHVMWFDAIALLPIVIMYTEKMLKRTNLIDIRFVIVLAFTFWSSFYLGYMISIFLFLYSIGIVLNEVKEIKNICQKLIKVILNGIMAAGVSAVFLIPIAISLTTNSGGFVSLKLYLRCIFTDIMYSFYLGNFDTYLPNGRPMLYCGIFSIILLFVYLKSKETVKREKIIDTIILLILLLSIEIAPIYFAWHMFDNPDWFEVRFSFIIIFFLLTLIYKALDKIKVIEQKDIIIGGIITAVILYFCIKIYNDLNGYVILANYLFIVGYSVLGKFFFGDNRKCKCIILTIVIAELCINANVVTKEMFGAEPTENCKYYNENLKKNKEIVSYIEHIDSGFYRMEKDYYRRENDLLAAGGKGISIFASSYNKEFHNMLGRFGITSTDKLIRYEGSTLVTDALLGIKYLCSQWGYYSDYNYLDEMYGKKIFQNPYAFGLGTLVDKDLEHVNINNMENPFEVQNEIVKKMFHISENIFYPVEPTEIKISNLQTETLEDGKIVYKKINQADEATIELTINKSQSYILYTYFPRECGDVSLWLNGMGISGFMGQTGKILNLENNTYGADTITIKVLINNEQCALNTKIFYALDRGMFSELFGKQNTASINQISASNIRLEVNVEKEQLLFLSIPYDRGWKIYVKGEPKKGKAVLGGFTGIILEQGNYEVELRYVPEGFLMGLIVSMGFIVLLAVYEIRVKINMRRTNK